MDEYRTITKLTKGRYLLRDSRQMWLAKKRKGKDGDEYVRISGYYTHFSTLFDGLAREGILQAGGQDLTDALDQLVKLEKDIQSIARKLGKELENAEQTLQGTGTPTGNGKRTRK